MLCLVLSFDYLNIMFKKYYDRIRKMLSNDIGVDLGTANTLVYVPGQGIVIKEPSVVALNQKTKKVVAVGKQAANMLGRTPAHISAIRPLVNGVISDFEIAQEMISYLVNKVNEDSQKILGPRMVIGIPTNITNVETRAVRDAAKNAGAREVHIVEEPMAAAIGIRLPIFEPAGNMIIDIGGGTTDIAVISLGGVVKSKNLWIAGDKLIEDICSYMRSEFKILVGEKTVEEIKAAIGSVLSLETPMQATMRGRDLVTGLPREVVVTDADLREAISQSIDTLVESIKEVLESTPPEIVADVMQRGFYLVGGGSMIKGIKELLSDWLKIPIHISEDPLTAVVRGTGVILENLKDYKEILIENEDELLPDK